jgi:hypothetical protein
VSLDERDSQCITGRNPIRSQPRGNMRPRATVTAVTRSPVGRIRRLIMASVTRRTASTLTPNRSRSGRRGSCRGLQVLLSTDAADATTGVQSYRWDDGRWHRADHRRALSARQVPGHRGLASLSDGHRLRRERGERAIRVLLPSDMPPATGPSPLPPQLRGAPRGRPVKDRGAAFPRLIDSPQPGGRRRSGAYGRPRGSRSARSTG